MIEPATASDTSTTLHLGLLAYWTSVSLEGAPVTQVSCCQCVDPVASFQTCFTEQKSLYEFIHEVELG